jgi:hypothetical protein
MSIGPLNKNLTILPCGEKGCLVEIPKKISFPGLAILVLGAAAIAMIIICEVSKNIDLTELIVGVTFVLACMAVGLFRLHYVQGVREKKAEADFVEEFEETPSSDPFDRDLLRCVTNGQLKTLKSSLQSARKQKLALEEKVANMQFMSPEERTSFQNEMADLRDKIETLETDFARKHRIASKVFPVYVTAS